MDNKNITGRELRIWLKENDLLMNLSPTQADVIIKTINQAGFELEIDSKNTIKQISVDQEGSHVIQTTIDDIVDLAAELNYESILIQKDKMNTEENISVVKSVKNLKEFLELQNESMLINQAFEQTVYAEKINSVLEKYTEMSKVEKIVHKSR